MEIPVLNRIGDYEILHQGPCNYFISQAALYVSVITRFASWKCGALLLLVAVVAVDRFRSFVLRFRRLPQEILLHYESDSGSVSDSGSDSDDEWRRVGEDFRVRGSERWRSRKLRHRHSRRSGDISEWPELGSGKSVVEVWRSPAVSPAVFVSAGEGAWGSVELRVWDRRVSRVVPEIITEWGSCQSRKASIGFGFERVLVGDLRKANAPLGSMTESEVGAWWDAGDVRVGVDE